MNCILCFEELRDSGLDASKTCSCGSSVQDHPSRVREVNNPSILSQEMKNDENNSKKRKRNQGDEHNDAAERMKPPRREIPFSEMAVKELLGRTEINDGEAPSLVEEEIDNDSDEFETIEETDGIFEFIPSRNTIPNSFEGMISGHDSVSNVDPQNQLKPDCAPDTAKKLLYEATTNKLSHTELEHQSFKQRDPSFIFSSLKTYPKDRVQDRMHDGKERRITKTSTEPYRIGNTPESSRSKQEVDERKMDKIPTITPISTHQQCMKWIVFSDLHVKSTTIDVCEEVLITVHQEAVKREAGIIFLGDFWHVRGTIGVELLNRVLKCLHTWTQPVIMIPGNHDQVTLGGNIHGLEPLRYSFNRDQVIIIDEPAIYLGALWIPYRRDQELMCSILTQAQSHRDISIIFCHADVKGAWMNDGIQSRDGLDINIFPSNVPIYSGHFHKPHQIESNSRSLTYVGSPYQTSLSEADQQKYFYCFTREQMFPTEGISQWQWSQVEKWPINFGRKYCKAYLLNDPKIKALRRNDRLVLIIPMIELSLAEEKARLLRKNGIEVEIRVEMNKNLLYDPAIFSSEVAAVTEYPLPQLRDQNDPIEIFKQFLNIISWKELEQARQIVHRSINSENSTDVETPLKEKLLTEGLKLIESALLRKPQFSAAVASSLERKELILSSVSLSNFGPYNQKVEYPLSKRGLVLIRGQLVDAGTGADSNGSGKTTLAMSILWCLTGSMDIRLISDSKSMEVVNDANLTEDVLSDNIAASSSSKRSSNNSRKFAEVKVEGMINQKPFQVTRRRYANKKPELLFQYANQDVTMQSIKETQQKINELLGIGTGLLQRCYFYGQHSHTTQSLLGLSDSKLKEELSSFINADIWTFLCSEVRASDRILTQDIEELNLKMEWKENDRQTIEKSLNKSKALIVNTKESERKCGEELGVLIRHEVASLNKIESLGNDLKVPLHTSYEERIRWIEEKISQIEQTKSQLQVLTILPLKQQLGNLLNSLQQVDDSTNSTLVNNLNEVAANQLETLKREYFNCIAKKNSTTQNLNIIINKLKDVVLKQRQAEMSIQDTINQNSTTTNNSAISTIVWTDYFPPNSEIFDEIMKTIEQYREQINHSNSSIGSLNQQYSIAEKNRNNLLQYFPKLRNLQNPPFTTSQMEEISVQETCPTCGQSFVQTNPEERYLQLTNESSLLQQQEQQHKQEKFQAEKIIKQLQLLHQKLGDYSQRSETIAEYEQSKQQYQQELTITEQTIQSLLPTIQQLEQEIQLRENQLQQEIQNKKQQLNDQTNLVRQQLTQSEHEYEQLNQQVTALHQFYQTLQKKSKEFSQKQQNIQSRIDLLTQQLSLEEQNKERYQQQLDEIQIEISRFKQEKEALHQQSYLLNHLLLLFSTKGIQQYIFQSFLSSLELITNYYLSYLSENGIQLRLIAETANNNSASSSSSDVATKELVFDKISKIVKIRTMYSNDWKERSLSQLSGGQWRRVSLALDFGFTHLVRQRSLLRCNVMVLDEILTHLDAKGRESVGSLLKAMVTEPSAALTREEEDRNDTEGEDTDDQAIANNKKKKIPSQDCVQTILVILQDLAAIELEESFDHMDLVLKEGETSKVIIDGGE